MANRSRFTDMGWREVRLPTLRHAAEEKLLTPLKGHGWAVLEVRDVENGEYLIIDVERAGHRHKVALLSTTAIDNRIYKALETQVDHILVNGDLWELKSFAYGIEKPISRIDAFRELLIKWNTESADGKFVPGPEPQIDSGPATTRHLLAEAPIDAIWLRIRQLTSVALARKVVQNRARTAEKDLDAKTIEEKAQGVAYAVRNAADYYLTGEHSNVSQRVLNLYYGSLAFAFAEMLVSADGPSALSEIEDITKQGHGLYTIDGEKNGLEHLVVGVIRSGFFPAWIKTLGVNPDNLPTKKPREYSDLGGMPSQTWLTIEDLFARIPEVADLFVDIFESKPAWVTPVFDALSNMGHLAAPRTSSNILMVDDSARLRREDISAFPGPISEIVEVAARLAGGKASTELGRHFRASIAHQGKDHWWEALKLHHSPFERTALILPAFGVSDYRAIALALLYGLSIVVRYRPSLWRRVQEGDLDHQRVLVEAFLAVVERVLPEEFLVSITAQNVFVRQPGSLF